MSVPWKSTRPESGRIRPLITLMRVVLPAPLEPMRASTSPAATAKSTWSTAWVSPKDLQSWEVAQQVHGHTARTGRARSRRTVPTMPAGRTSTRATSTIPSTICQYTVWPTAYVSR